jgi:hypothetical protein
MINRGDVRSVWAQGSEDSIYRLAEGKSFLPAGGCFKNGSFISSRNAFFVPEMRIYFNFKNCASGKLKNEGCQMAISPNQILDGYPSAIGTEKISCKGFRNAKLLLGMRYPLTWRNSTPAGVSVSMMEELLMIADMIDSKKWN